MVKTRIISTFLLFLLLLVNWHNTALHAHEVLEENEFGTIPDHDHAHHSYHHDQPDSGIFSWFQQLVGDFEHADLGEDHFKVFLHPQHQTGANQPVSTPSLAFALLPGPISLKQWQPLEKNKMPDRVRSFSDPPFLEIVANRGPPTFS